MKKTAVVVVTYNRKEKLKENIRCLLNQTKQPDCIYIIDNASTDGTFDDIKNLLASESSMKYIRMQNNLGGAGGFYEGMRQAYEDGMDYIWGMDDDAFPKEDALQQIFDVKTDFPEKYCFWSNCNKDGEFDGRIKEVEDWMFVGYFVPREVIQRIGYPRKDFFIYYDDREYADRIIRAGYKILKVRDSVIQHEDTVTKEYRSKRVFGKTFRYPMLPDWKNYYFIRNNILRYKLTDARRYKVIFYWCPMFLIKLCMIYPKQVPNFLKAYFHGVFGISGPRIKP